MPTSILYALVFSLICAAMHFYFIDKFDKTLIGTIWGICIYFWLYSMIVPMFPNAIWLGILSSAILAFMVSIIVVAFYKSTNKKK